MQNRNVLAIVIIFTATTGSIISSSALLLHSRLNQLDAVDDFDSVVGSTKLNAANYEQQLSASQFNLILFYAPWCEYCLKVLPQWNESGLVIGEHYPEAVRIGHVDCIREESLCFKLDVGADLPSIRVYTRGPPQRFEQVQPYELEDTIEYLQDYLFNSTESSGSY